MWKIIFFWSGKIREFCNWSQTEKDSESQGIWKLVSVEGFKKDTNFASRVSNDTFSKVEEC